MIVNRMKYNTCKLSKLTIPDCINILYNVTCSTAKKIAISKRLKELVKYIDYIEENIDNGKYTLEKNNNIIVINYYLKTNKTIYLH